MSDADRVVLVDIGARDGIDRRWMPFVGNLSIFAFEPDPVECDRLNDIEHDYRITYLPYALGAVQEEKRTLHITRQPGCSSLLMPNTELLSGFEYGKQLEVVRQVEVAVNRLDSILEVSPDVIKIDTQGTELEILEGSEELLSNVTAIEVEVEFVEMYKDQPLFADVDSFLRSHGFFLRGLRRDFWRNSARVDQPFGGQLMHGDALYLRQSLLASKKGFLILAAYRQYDLLANLGGTHFIPSQKLFERIVRRLISLLPYSNRDFRRTVDWARSGKATDWHDSDFF